MSRVAWAQSTLLVLYLVTVEPLWGWREYRRLKAGSTGEAEPLLRLYRLTVTVEWAWIGYLSMLVLFGGIAISRLVTPPDRMMLPVVIANVGPGLIVGMMVGIVGGAFVAARGMQSKAKPRTVGDFDALRPRTSRERRWLAAVAVTAGVCEEVVFRGFLFFYVSRLLPGAGTLVIVVLAAGVFSAAHAYQGWLGVAGTFGLGVVFGFVYLATGSLVPGIVMHSLLDLRLLVGTGGGERSPA